MPNWFLGLRPFYSTFCYFLGDSFNRAEIFHQRQNKKIKNSWKFPIPKTKNQKEPYDLSAITTTTTSLLVIAFLPSTQRVLVLTHLD
jgi:hypothetical protein